MTTKASRELRLRHHIIQANQLKMMPLEHVSSRVEGVWNLANSQVNSIQHFFLPGSKYLQKLLNRVI